MNKYLMKSFVIWGAWIVTLAGLQILYNNNIITDTLLGNWTMDNYMYVVSIVFILGWLIWSAYTFASQSQRLF